jgi:alpha-L-fucosidase 2
VAAAFLGMAEEAYGRLQVMAVKRSMNLSLITSHEPNAAIFNTDGNGGIPQIVNTMLLQSRNPLAKREFEIHLLPALPAAWPRGKVSGLRARGGFTVDIEWQDGKVTNYHITSPQPRDIKVRANGEVTAVHVGL